MSADADGGLPLGEPELDDVIATVTARELGWNIGTDGFAYEPGYRYPVEFVNERSQPVTFALFIAPSGWELGDPAPAGATFTSEVAPGAMNTFEIGFAESGDYVVAVEPPLPDDPMATRSWGGSILIEPE